ncbi:MAG: hypothetical protein ACI9RO_001679 [Alteromonas macleodii]|jgi:hypothetical protein
MNSTILSLITHLAAGMLAALVTQWVARQNRHQTERNRDYEAEMASRLIRREKLLDAFRVLDASEPQRCETQKLSNDEMLKLKRTRSAAFADIGLFGDESLIHLLDQSIQEGISFDTSILMRRLRDFLRELYSLEPTDVCYQWFKIQLPLKTDEVIQSNYLDVDSESQI